jgi:hypothetical protein
VFAATTVLRDRLRTVWVPTRADHLSTTQVSWKDTHTRIGKLEITALISLHDWWRKCLSDSRALQEVRRRASRSSPNAYRQFSLGNMTSNLSRGAFAVLSKSRIVLERYWVGAPQFAERSPSNFLRSWLRQDHEFPSGPQVVQGTILSDDRRGLLGGVRQSKYCVSEAFHGLRLSTGEAPWIALGAAIQYNMGNASDLSSRKSRTGTGRPLISGPAALTTR